MSSTWQCTEQQHDATQNKNEKTAPKGHACLNVPGWLNLSNYYLFVVFCCQRCSKNIRLAANDVVKTNEPWNTHLGHILEASCPDASFRSTESSDWSSIKQACHTDSTAHVFHIDITFSIRYRLVWLYVVKHSQEFPVVGRSRQHPVRWCCVPTRLFCPWHLFRWDFLLKYWTCTSLQLSSSELSTARTCNGLATPPTFGVVSLRSVRNSRSFLLDSKMGRRMHLCQDETTMRHKAIP